MLMILNPCEKCENANHVQWRSKRGGRPPPHPPNRHKNHSLKKAKSVENFFFGGGGTRYMPEAETD